MRNGVNSMISLNQFLDGVQKNIARVTHYQSAGDGSSDGGCDCIGLIIGAIRLAGGKWNGTHGSNWAARNAMNGILKVSSASQLAVGHVVYKAHEPGESGYNLPSAYCRSPDQRDYYHVGVVTSVSPLKISHVTKDSSRGVDGNATDTTLGKWKYAGTLKYVDYDSYIGGDAEMDDQSMDALPIYQAVITASSGKTVRMRKEPSVNSKILYNVPIGESVDVLGQYDDTWDRIEYKGIRGYMMRRFLASGSSVPEYPEDGAEAVLVERTKLKEIQACLVDALSVVDHLLGVG